MSVDADTVRRIAHLARIAVAEDEVEHFKGELNAILAWVEQLQAVDVAGVAPMTSVTPMTMKMRTDEVTDGGKPADIVKNAPQSDDKFFLRSQGGGIDVHRLRNELLGHDRRAAAGGARAHPARAGGTLCLRGAANRRRKRRRRPSAEPRKGRARAVSELTALTLAQARDGLKKKSFTAAELADAHLAAIEKARALNAFVLETPERAAEMAKAADARIASGGAAARRHSARGQGHVLHSGVRSTACSHILGNFVPPYESTVTSQLWRDGAVLLGKLNNDEFAMGSSNETSYLVSPWCRRGPAALGNQTTPLVPGGSSGGSASAVAAQLCLGATATDTGGSIRQPAAFTGTVGMKPTYGRCSRWGIVAFASSLDQAGPFARTVRDAAILLRSMAGPDAKDTTCADLPVPDYEKAVGKSVKGLRIGIPKEYRIDGMPPEIEKLWEQGRAWLKAAGAELVEVSLPHTKYALAGLLHRGAGGGLVQSGAL